uniref:A kinase-anchoring proteins AKAP-5 and AKAP-12 calmodulin (CaM)-binding domain-containing protein n=1 Tax=Amphiprion ocellaris TaxID=80972 RepID=A0AAQ5XE47_AMPOC
MGDAQSAQRDAQEDAEPGEDVQTEQSTEEKPLENKEPISELNGKADGTLAGFRGHTVDAAEGIPSPDKDVPNVEINANNPNEEEEEVPVKMIEMEAKQNEINENFKRFFNNIGLKLTVRKGSTEKGEIQVPEEEPNKQEDIKDTAKESENAEKNKELNAAQEAYDNDSTTGPTMTDGTSEDLLDTETKMEAESNKADAATSSHGSEGGNQEATPEDVVISPFKRLSLQFKTGFFSGLRKKKNEPAGKELVDMGKKEEATEQTVQDQQQDKVEDEADIVWKELQEIKPKDVSAASAQTTDEAKSPSTDPSAIIVTECETLSSQEKVQASPMKRLLSGSSLKKLSKKQRGRKLSDGRLSDSGEHSSDHLMSSTESADNPREDSSPQSSAEATGEEEGPWASFKKLMTPKKRMKGSSSGHEEAQVPASVHEAKPSQGEQTSDHSSEEGRKRKDSSVSWEAVLCGSGRRRSRKTSDPENESPQNDNADNKQDSGAKQGTETQLERSNEVHETLASSTRQAGSLPESDGGSTWQSFKKLVTPKRKAKDEDEGKDNIHSDSEITQDDSSFSIKKLLPGRKKRKSGERQDQVSSDEAEKEVASGDEDSETPAVVPLSEFDTAETGIQIQTQADIESDAPKVLEDKLKQDDMTKPVLPCDDQQIEATTVRKKEEALKNEASTAPVTNEEPDEELISKHQQLSDITEEGAITDTMATPASTNEEAARDDTIAEDLIEITSEAITAPETVDVTLADETEMISAVSQLSESSKTSGNTTPVPAELDVKDTELLLQEVVENIQMSQDAVPVCSEDSSSEKERPDVEATDAPHDLATTAQPESVSDTNEPTSTDIISEVPTEEFDTADITADDAYKEDVSQLQDTMSELEVSEENRHKVECVSEVNEAVSVETLPEGEEVVPDSVVEADEAEISKMDSQDAEPVAAVAEGPKDGAVEQEIQILVEKEDQILENVRDQVPFEDQPAVVADKQEELGTVETNELASEKSNAQSLEKNIPFSEDILPAEKVTDELKQTAEHLTGVTDEPENKEPQSDEPIIDQHEVMVVVQEAIVDSEDGSVQSLEKEATSEDVPPEETLPFPEVGVMLVKASKTERIQEQEVLQAVVLDREVSSPESLAKEVISEDVPPEETVTDEPKEETAPLAEDNVALVDTPKTKHIQKTEASQAVQAATLDSEGCSAQVLEKEVISEDVPPEEMARDETKEEPVPLAEGNVESVDASKTEHIQEPETLQTATLDSEVSSPQLPQKEVISEEVPSEETVKEEPKKDTVLLAGVNVEPVDVSKMEHIQEPEVLQAEDSCKESEILQVVQAATLDSEAGGSQLIEKKVKSEDVPPEEMVGEEPKEDTVTLAEVNVEPMDAPKTEHIQEPETLQAITLDSEAGSPELPQKEVISEDVPPEETVSEEVEGKPVPIAEVNVEPVDAPKTKHIQEPETLQADILDSEAGRPESLEKKAVSADVPPEETVKDEPKEETVPLTEDNDEPVSDYKIKQEPEVLQTATLDSEAGSSQLLKKEVISEDAPPEETAANEPKQETVPLAEINVEPVDAPKTEHIQERETLQAATLDSEAGSPELPQKEVISEDVPPEETVTNEPKQETVPIAEVNVEPVDASKTKHIQEPETLQAATLDSEAGSPELPQKEVISEDVPPEETVKDEPKKETIPLAKVKAESVDASKEPEVLQTVQETTLDSEAGSPELPQKEVISDDVPPEETVTNEPKQETVPIAKVNVEPVDAPKTEHIQELETLQAATLDSEAGSPELPQKTVISEDVPPEETVTNELKQETVPIAEGNDEPVDDSKIKQEPEVLQTATLDSEAGSSQLLEKEVISEDAPPEETVSEEVKDKPVPIAEVNVEPVDTSKTKHIQEPEVLQAATLDSEAGSPELPQKEVISKDVPPEETVKDEPKKETVPLAKVKAESVDASKEPEVLQTVQETTSNSEAGGPQLLEKKEISEDVETVTDEPKEAPEVSTELEKPPMEPEVLAPDVKEVVTETETGAAPFRVEECNAQEKQILLDDVTKPAGEYVIASVPEETDNKVVDQALERNNDQKTERLAQGVEVEVSTTEAVEDLETTAADNVLSVMEEASCVQILEETVLSKETPEPCVDSAEASDEPTHEVQVNGIGDKINGLPSAEMKTAEVQHVVVMQVTACNLKDEIPGVLVETTSETHEPLINTMAGETELKEGVESAAPLVEDSVEVEDNHRIQVQLVDVDIKSLIKVGVTEDKKVTDVCHETIEKVEVLSATSGIEDEVFNKETKAAVQGDIPNVKENLPQTIPESLVASLEQEILKDALTEVVENESSQAKNQKEIKDGTEKFSEGQDEGSAVISDGSAIPTGHHDSHMQTSVIPGDLDVSVHDQEEDLEETKADEIRPSEELAVKKVIEKTTEAQQITQIVTTSNTGQVAQQNTGTISSMCNMESPTSFSFEVKFNIQFEKTKVPESPTSPTETRKPVKQTDVSEVGVQVVETVASINATERDEKQITEPAVNLDSNKMTKTTSQAAQLDVGILAVETITPVEEITSTETVTPSIQAAETIQPETQTESREVFLSQPALNEAKAKEPTVEENDDVWQDAEEEVYTQQQTEKVKEPWEQDEKAEHGQEAQQETDETEGTREIESEGEHFVAALEHPETVTTGDMTMDLN